MLGCDNQILLSLGASSNSALQSRTMPKNITLEMLAASPRHDTRRPPKVPPSIRPSSKIKTTVTSQKQPTSRPTSSVLSRPSSGKTSGYYSATTPNLSAKDQSRASTAVTRPSTAKTILRNETTGEETISRPEPGSRAKSAATGRKSGTSFRRHTSTISVNSNLNVTAKLSDSMLNLIEAAERGDEDTVAEIVSNYEVSQLSKKLGEIRSPLNRAAGYGQLATIEQLVKAGANVDTKSSRGGRTALHEACIGGHVKVVRFLSSQMSSVDVTDGQGQTASHLAALHGEADCLTELAQSRAFFNIADDNGRNPAHLAASRNQVQALQVLASQHCDLGACDSSGKTPAHYAAQHGAFEALSLLVSQDVDIREMDNLGQQPIHLAAAHNQLRCLRALIKKAKCEWHAADKRGRNTAHLAAVHGSLECLHWILENHDAANIPDSDGNTPTHLSAAHGKPESFNCCLQHGGSLVLANSSGDIPVDCAKRKGHPVSIQKAYENLVKCYQCVEKHQHLLWNMTHPETEASRNMGEVLSLAYKPVMPTQRFTPHENYSRVPTGAVEKSRLKAEMSKLNLLPKEEIAAQFYGKI